MIHLTQLHNRENILIRQAVGGLDVLEHRSSYGSHCVSTRDYRVRNVVESKVREKVVVEKLGECSRIPLYADFIPPGGLEPPHMVPETIALSPELWGHNINIVVKTLLDSS